MRLSEAMMLDSTTCKMVSGDMNSCAIGVACNAVGLARHSYGSKRHDPGNRYAKLPAYWSWLSDSSTNRDSMLRAQFPTPSYWNSVPYDVLIFELFDRKVCAGKMTLERLVDMVRHDEPQCECNRFDCDCDCDCVEPSAEVACGTEPRRHEDAANHDAELVAR